MVTTFKRQDDHLRKGNTTVQDVGSIITKHKEQCAHTMQAQILMALRATASIEAKHKTIDGQYKNLLSFLAVVVDSFPHTGPPKFTFSSSFGLNSDFM